MIKNRLPHIMANDFQLMYLFVRLYDSIGNDGCR